jgi:hypothetical protein
LGAKHKFDLGIVHSSSLEYPTFIFTPYKQLWQQ